MKFRVLLIEDSIKIQELVNQTLKSVAVVDGFDSVAPALEAIRKQEYDACLVDLSLGASSGFEFIHELRQNNMVQDMPVCVLSADSTIESKEKAFELGATDYLVKPFEPKELEIRLRRLVLRDDSVSVRLNSELTFRMTLYGLQIIDEKEGRKIEFSQTEERILSFLMCYEGRVCSRQEIIKKLWPQGDGLSERLIDRHISAIKNKVDELGPRIRSIRGVCYIFDRVHTSAG